MPRMRAKAWPDLPLPLTTKKDDAARCLSESSSAACKVKVYSELAM